MKSRLFPKSSLRCPSHCRHHFYFYLYTPVSRAGFPTWRGNHVCVFVEERKLRRPRAGSSPSLGLSLLNSSGARWRQKQQIPTVPSCYGHTFRKSPRNCQRTFLSNRSIRSFVSAEPLFTPKAVVWMKGWREHKVHRFSVHKLFFPPSPVDTFIIYVWQIKHGSWGC